MEIKFEVPGVVVSKARPRHFQKGNFHGSYTPQKTVNFENLVKFMFCRTYSGKPVSSPIKAHIVTYFPITKSWPKRKKTEALSYKVPVTKKPDADNIAKSILDGLNNIAYEDDKQVYSLTVEKWYGEIPRTEVTLTYNSINHEE